MASTVTHRGTTFNTTAGNKTVVATPAAGDLIVVIAASSGVATTAVTDTQSGTYVQVDSNRTGFSTTGTLNAWVRTALIPAASSTTWTATQTSSTGGGLTVISLSGMTLLGAAAVRSSGGQSTGTAGTTPAPVLSLTPLSSNPIIAAVASANTVAGSVLVQRTGYTEDFDNIYSTPPTALEVAHRASGETSATLTAGGTSTTAFASIALELQFNSAPTVALNSPADTGTVATTTPELDFTGTDADSDTISYEVQVDTVNTFDSGVDSYGISNQDSATTLSSGNNFAVAQSFTGDGSVLTSASFYLNKHSGSPTGNAVAKIYAETHATAFGVDSLPTGSALATSDTFDASTLTTAFLTVKLAFSGVNQITLTNATKYVVSFEYSGGDASNNVGIGQDNSSPTHAGNKSAFFSGTWTALSQDLCFYVNSNLLDKLSASDTGFTDITNGAHTDPFTSAEQIGYTIQAGDALTNGSTYYWRVRGKDPSGTGTFGAWATTRSFTVSSGTSTTVTQVAATVTATGGTQATATGFVLEAWGGGGAGGYTVGVSATGGGGGAYSKTSGIAISSGTGYTVTVGAAVAGRASGGSGTVGNDSWFSTTGVAPISTTEGVLAKGGKGGTNGGAAGAGGAAASGIGDTRFSGGNGFATNAGGGGGGAGSTGAGGNSASTVGGTGTAVDGGNGGAGTSSGAAGTGSAAGGGGGGSVSGTSSGGGAVGQVRITAPLGMISSATGGTHTTDAANDIWTFTATGTWTPTTSASASITQVAGVVTATGGTQLSVTSATVSQVAATVTATGGTQTVASVQNVAISQLAGVVTASGGIQVVAAIVIASASVTQTGATVTASGGTQVVATRNIVSITQSAATVTTSGGTQTIATVNNVALAQVAGVVTASGGTQVIVTLANVAIAQAAATVTATGGTQTVASIQKVALAQLAATVTASGGTQTVSTVNNVSLTQSAGVVTATGGTQVIATSNYVSLAQLTAAVTASGGVQTVSATASGSTAVSMLALLGVG